MRRILVSCAVVGVLALPAAAIARSSAAAKPGYVVVRKAVGNGGVNGPPVVTLVVQGFVLGRVAQEGQVEIVQLPTVSGRGAPQHTPGVSARRIHWHGLTGQRVHRQQLPVPCDGRPVPRGHPRHGRVSLRRRAGVTSSFRAPLYVRADGTYSVNGGRPRSLPKRPVKRKIGGG